MPRGRSWRGAEQGKPCPRRLRRFLEPCVLLVLHKRDAYGYELTEDVKAYGFGEPDPVDASLIYRTLRWLEENNMVVSRWDTESSAGPARRVYQLTEEGDRYLAAWMADLDETAHLLESFVAEYRHHMERGEGEHHDSSSHQAS